MNFDLTDLTAQTGGTKRLGYLRNEKRERLMRSDDHRRPFHPYSIYLHRLVSTSLTVVPVHTSDHMAIVRLVNFLGN